MRKRLIDLSPMQKLMSLSIDTDQIHTQRHTWRRGFFTGFIVGAFVFGILLALMVLLLYYVRGF